jgi:hypothetical protein
MRPHSEILNRHEFGIVEGELYLTVDRTIHIKFGVPRRSEETERRIDGEEANGTVDKKTFQGI